MDNIIFTINTVSPVFLIIILGIILKRINIITDEFVNSSSKIVFKVGLPALIFVNIASTNFTEVFSLKIISILYGGTIVVFLLGFFITVFLKSSLGAKGSFVQGSTRGNIAILGLAIVSNVFTSKTDISKAAVILSFIIPLYNILSVIALTVFVHSESKGAVKKIVINIITNPLIIAVFVALPFSLLQIPILPVLESSIITLSKMTLPLALLGVGASLSFQSLKRDALISLLASVLKIIITPLIVTTASYLLGVTGNDLALIFIISACPTAVASFIMAKAMDNDANVAANIILITTLGSIITMGFGIYILKSIGIF